MKKTTLLIKTKLLFAITVVSCQTLISQTAPYLQWQKCFGSSGWDTPFDLKQASDGGYIIGGDVTANNGDVTGYHGGASDAWFIKTDTKGNAIWKKTFGGTDQESFRSIQQTTDGGYIAAGITYSNNGDATGNHGGGDMWVVKLNSLGTIQWQKCFGGTALDYANYISKTSDGGYIVTGKTSSTNGDVTGNHGGGDIWVLKLNAMGTIQWKKCFGGSASDEASSIKQTTDGGYILGGVTSSTNGDVVGKHGAKDVWIIKLNSTGTIQWKKCLGGSNDEIAKSIQQTADGGYIIAGDTDSNDGDVSGNHGGIGQEDAWIVKLNNNGNIAWQKCIGSFSHDGAQSIEQTADGGFMIFGWTGVSSWNITHYHGMTDAWTLKMDHSGNYTTAKSFGGSGLENCGAFIKTSDTGYALLCSSTSNDGDVHGNHNNSTSDFWLAKITSENTIAPNALFGEASGLSGLSDQTVTSIQVDGTGNKYIAGYCTSITDFNPGAGITNFGVSGKKYMFLAKYTIANVLLWAKLTEISSIPKDNLSLKLSNTNIYMTGNFSGTVDFDPSANVFKYTSSGLEDMFLLSMDLNGNFYFANKMGGTGNDAAKAIDVDATGNIYLTGYFSGTVDFDTNPLGTVNLISVGKEDIFYAKYNTYGALLFAKNIGTINSEISNDISVDGNNNLYITGTYNSTIDFDPSAAMYQLYNQGTQDVFIAKYSATTGNFIWAKDIGGANGKVISSVIKADNNFVYLAGAYNGSVDFDPNTPVKNLTTSGAIQQGYVAKYDVSGVYKWAKPIKASSGITVTANAIDIDNVGNLYVTGEYNGAITFGLSTILNTSGAEDMYTARYSDNGEFLWAFKTGGIGKDNAKDLFINKSKEVFTCGSYSNTVDFNPSAATFNLTSAGMSDGFWTKYSQSNEFSLLQPTNDENLRNSDISSAAIIEKEEIIKLYPNPNAGSFTVTLSEVKGQVESEGVYSIMNELGQIVHEFNLNSSNNYTFSIDNLSNGIYFVIGFNNNQITREKVIVTK